MMLNLTVMMYHYVRDVGDAAEAGSGIPGLPVQAFTAQVDELARQYEMVSWKDVRGAVLGQKALPERACLLTFDDGVCDHYLNVFPILAKRNIAGLFFAIARENETVIPLPHKLHYLIAKLGLQGMRDEIWARLTETQRATMLAAEARYRLRYRSETDIVKGALQRDLEPEIGPLLTEVLERHVGPEAELARLFLTNAQIQAMHAGGMNFGGHTRTHPWLDFVDPARRATEIRASQTFLERVEQAPFAFAYPYGGLASDAPIYLQDDHFRAAFTTRDGTAHADPFYIGRYDGEEWNG